MEATTSSVGAHGFVVGTDGARATRPLFGRSGRPVPGGRGRDVPARASIAAAGAWSSRGGGRGIAKTVIGAGARARCGRVASRSPELAPLPPRMDEIVGGRTSSRVASASLAARAPLFRRIALGERDSTPRGRRRLRGRRLPPRARPLRGASSSLERFSPFFVASRGARRDRPDALSCVLYKSFSPIARFQHLIASPFN